MTTEVMALGSSDTDNEVDKDIFACLNPIDPKSFFLYAGAGSGKTRSLKNALEFFMKTYGHNFYHSGKKIAVITYTNAAADEIAARLGQNSIFPVSTIHSFCWAQTGAYFTDIQSWLLTNLPLDLAELQQKQTNGRSGTKAALDRERSMAAINKRIEWLCFPRKFTYNPNGNNFGYDSLSHAEVLKITADFIISKPSMQSVLVNKYPFILIDESQDTSKILMNALFTLAAANKGKFALGLFGDTMQRIYADGHPDLERQIPADWITPVKLMNHRSSQRVVQLGNALRADVDDHRQLAREDSPHGTIRLFIVPATTADKPAVEGYIRSRMALLCDDSAWNEGAKAVKTLTLEHHMAASRCGFLSMFQALDKSSQLSPGLKRGDLAGLRLFTERIVPLLAAWTAGNKFEVMSHLRKYSPLLKKSALASSDNSNDPLQQIRQAMEELTTIDIDDPSVKFIDILHCVAKYGLFEIPPGLQPFVGAEIGSQEPFLEDEVDEEVSPSSLQAWRDFLETPYNQIMPYTEYISDHGPYGTHQGVKGLEFDRVFVVLDDSEARGFLFSYEKLLGAKPLSDNDREKVAEGGETGLDRTRRLLYVTCTRARNSLALVAYTTSPDKLAAAVVRQGWFTEDELERIAR